MSLLSLPDECILGIASWIQPLQSLHSLCLVNHRLYSMLEPILYQQDALHSPYSTAISWAAEHGIMPLLQKALDYGAVITIQAIMGPQKQVIDHVPILLYGIERIYPYHYDCPAHPLTLATKCGHYEIVEFLLERKCNPHMRNPDDFTLLELAVISGNFALVETFLGLGLRQNEDRGGFNSHSPLQLAAFHGDAKIVALLLYGLPHAKSHGQHNRPSTMQVQIALTAAIKVGHKQILLQLLFHGVDVNCGLVEPEEDAVRQHLQSLLSETGWAGGIHQVHSFVNHAAGTKSALLEAVESGNPDLVEILVCHKSIRVLSTRALCRAVDAQDTVIIKILLANGVKPDFEEWHRPQPTHPEEGCCFGDTSWPEEYIPPLVRAVNLGNIALVKLLIASGADVNVGYHDLHKIGNPSYGNADFRLYTKSRLFCGRVVQLAMELRYLDIVEFLLECGAEISLKHPRYRFHNCPPRGRQSRNRHLRITAGLRAAAGKVNNK